MSESSDTDANGSVIFVTEQHTVRVDVHPVPNPPNPANIVPETQEISASNSTSNNPEEDFIDVDTIPEKHQTFLMQQVNINHLDT